MKSPIKVCTCTQCRLTKAKKSANRKKRVKRYTNKKLRKMDLDKPEVINFYWA